MMGKIAQATKGATKAQHSFLSAIGKAAGKSLEPLTSFAKGLANVASRFKRILMYRMVRKVISEIGKAFKEGVKNVYAWSAATGGQLAASMDDATASINYLKNSIGAAASPLINALAPAIRVVTDAVVELINVINQLLALLGGQTSWTRAIRNTDEYANAVSGAGGAAKEALRYLAPFDELNVLPKDSGGGGGGGSAVDYSSMFEETTEFAQGIADFAQSIRDAVSAGDWQGLGELLGNKVNEIVNMIDWSGIGTKIGEKINAFFTTKYWTLETINFQNIGARIAELLNSAISNIDFEVIGRTFVQSFTILPDMIIGFIETLDWATVGQSVGRLVSGGLSQAGKWLKETDFNELGYAIYNGIDTAFKGIEWSGLFDSAVEFFSQVNVSQFNFLDGIVDAMVDSIKSGPAWEMLESWFDNDLGARLKNAWIRVVNFFKQAWTDALNQLVDEYNDSWLSNLFGKAEHFEVKLTPELDPPPGQAYASWKSQFEASSRNNPAQATAGIDEILIGSGGSFSGSGGFTLQGGRLRMETMAYFTSYSAKFSSGASSKDASRPLISSTARFDIYKSHFKTGAASTNDARPVIQSTARFDIYKSHFKSGAASSNDARPVIQSTARFDIYKSHFKSGSASTDDSRPVIQSTARFDIYKGHFKSGAASNDDSRPVMASTARFDEMQKNIDTTFGSTANFTNRWDNISTTFNSTANIVEKEISVAKMDGYMKIDSTANIVKTAGINHVNLNATATVTRTLTWGGGVYKNGEWSPIQSYATGGLPQGGQIFRARENGNPELVGTLHGSTAVMNNDQIVASVSSGVAKAIAGIRFQMTGGGGTDTEQMMYSAFSRALAENNEEITLDGDVVYSKMLSRNRRETYRTGVNPMAAMA